MEPNLASSRVKAAEASRGTSSDPIYRAVLARIGSLDVSGRALDFGAGTGRLATLLCETGEFDRVDAVDIVDYSDGVGHPKVRWFFADLNQPLPAENGTYDLIVAAEVIEHLENPRFLAREWYRLLRPGGALVVSTPNNESWRSLVSLTLRGHFAGFTGASYPAHITALLRKDLERIFTEAGFERIAFYFTHHGGVPKRPSLTWQRVSFGFLRGLRYSDSVICMARKPA